MRLMGAKMSNKKQLADSSPAVAAAVLDAAIAECRSAGLPVGVGWSDVIGDRPAGIIIFCGGLRLDGDGRLTADPDGGKNG